MKHELKYVFYLEVPLTSGARREERNKGAEAMHNLWAVWGRKTLESVISP